MASPCTSKNLGSDFTWVLWGNAFYSACQWGIVLILAKLGSPQQVGEYALGLAVSAPILLFANFQLRSLLASDVTDQFNFSEYFRFRMISLTAALAVVAGVSVTQQSREQGVIILLVALTQALDLVSETYYGWMQKSDRLGWLAGSLTIKGPLSVALLCGAMYFTGSLPLAVLGLAAGRLIVLLSWDSRLKSSGSDRAMDGSSTSIFRLLRMAFPLGVISMLGALYSSIPRWFLDADRGSAELGIFSAIAALLSIGNLVIAAFGQSIFVPAATAYRASDRARLRGFVALAAGVGSVLGGAGVLGAVLFGRTILARLLRPEYGQHADVFVHLMIAGTVSFVASGVGYVITAAQSFQPQIPVLVATVFSATLAAAFLIPSHGLLGAADSMLVAAVVQLAGTCVVFGRIDRQLGETSASRLLQDLETVQGSGVEA